MTLLHRSRAPLPLPGTGLRSRGRSRTGHTGPVPVVVPVVPHREQPPGDADQRTAELPVRAPRLSLRDLGELYDR